MAHSTRTPILRRPDEYGLDYEDVFFPALDGVTLEGWFIPADSDRLIISATTPCRAIATGTPKTNTNGPNRRPDHRCKKCKTPCDQGLFLERATRFELATLTLAR